MQGQVQEGDKEGTGFFLSALRAVDNAAKMGQGDVDFNAIGRKKPRVSNAKGGTALE